MVKILVNTTRKHYVEVDVFLETIVILIMIVYNDDADLAVSDTTPASVILC